jgi:hypothetical protein
MTLVLLLAQNLNQNLRSFPRFLQVHRHAALCREAGPHLRHAMEPKTDPA